MLEILYDTATLEVRAWNTDESVQGNLQPKAEQEVVIWDIEPPTFESDIYFVDLGDETVVVNPDYIPPEPLSFVPASSGTPAKVAAIEAFLGQLYP